MRDVAADDDGQGCIPYGCTGGAGWLWALALVLLTHVRGRTGPQDGRSNIRVRGVGFWLRRTRRDPDTIEFQADTTGFCFYSILCDILQAKQRKFI